MKRVVLSVGFVVAFSAVALAQTPAAPAAAPAAPAADVKATIVTGKNATVTQAALWSEGGKPMIARGAEAMKTAPKDATIANLRVYPLMGFTFREVTFPKGAKFLTPMGPMDTVLYVVKGRIKVKLGGVEGEVGPGDTLRKISGQISSYEILEEAVVLETDADPAARK